MSLQGKQDHGLPVAPHIPTLESGDCYMWRELESEDRTELGTNWELQDQTIHSVLCLWLGQLRQCYSKPRDRKARLYRGAELPGAAESLS